MPADVPSLKVPCEACSPPSLIYLGTTWSSGCATIAHLTRELNPAKNDVGNSYKNLFSQSVIVVMITVENLCKGKGACMCLYMYLRFIFVVIYICVFISVYGCMCHMYGLRP